jgi:hypothetical protein
MDEVGEAAFLRKVARSIKKKFRNLLQIIFGVERN